MSDKSVKLRNPLLSIIFQMETEAVPALRAPSCSRGELEDDPSQQSAVAGWLYRSHTEPCILSILTALTPNLSGQEAF